MNKMTKSNEIKKLEDLIGKPNSYFYTEQQLEISKHKIYGNQFEKQFNLIDSMDFDSMVKFTVKYSLKIKLHDWLIKNVVR